MAAKLIAFALLLWFSGVLWAAYYKGVVPGPSRWDGLRWNWNDRWVPREEAPGWFRFMVVINGTAWCVMVIVVVYVMSS